jgi:hypothetical protein
MRTKRFVATALVAAAVAADTWLFAAPASATSSCVQDGVAQLCATATPVQDVMAIDWGVTQMDGPGNYSVYYVDQTTGQPSTPQQITSLPYQVVVSGRQYGSLTHCFVMVLTSPPGTSLATNPVC